LADLDEVRPRSPSLPPIVIRPHLFGALRRPQLTLSSEVAGSMWVSFSTLQRTHGEATVDVRGTSLQVPAFLIGPTVIWGLTERIITGFIELIGHP
jgi:hypothetical protein